MRNATISQTASDKALQECVSTLCTEFTKKDEKEIENNIIIELLISCPLTRPVHNPPLSPHSIRSLIATCERTLRRMDFGVILHRRIRGTYMWYENVALPNNFSFASAPCCRRTHSRVPPQRLGQKNVHCANCTHAVRSWFIMSCAHTHTHSTQSHVADKM